MTQFARAGTEYEYTDEDYQDIYEAENYDDYDYWEMFIKLMQFENKIGTKHYWIFVQLHLWMDGD